MEIQQAIYTREEEEREVGGRGGAGLGLRSGRVRLCRVTQSRIFLFCLLVLAAGASRGFYVLAGWIRSFKETVLAAALW
jgi:hypothetical protein